MQGTPLSSFIIHACASDICHAHFRIYVHFQVKYAHISPEVDSHPYHMSSIVHRFTGFLGST